MRVTGIDDISGFDAPSMVAGPAAALRRAKVASRCFHLPMHTSAVTHVAVHRLALLWFFAVVRLLMLLTVSILS